MTIKIVMMMMMAIKNMRWQATQPNGERVGKVEPSLGRRDLVPGGSPHQRRPHPGILTRFSLVENASPLAAHHIQRVPADAVGKAKFASPW